MKIRRTALTVLATASLVVLPASAFAGTSGDDYQQPRDGYQHVEHPKYAPPCPDHGDHRPPVKHTPPPPTTTTVTRTLHTL